MGTSPIEMSQTDRTALYTQIEKHRDRPLIAYVTSKRAGINAAMATDALPYIIEQIDALPKESKNVDFLIAGYGGDPMVAWRIVTLIRQRIGEKGHVAVLIPQSAYSAATLVALGANKIVMHPHGHLGPVDMQITTWSDSGGTKRFSTEDISAFLDFVRDSLRITDQKHIRALFERTCDEVGALGIGFTARSSKLAVDLGERLLSMHMKDDEAGTKVRALVENMSRNFRSHAYPVSRNEAEDLGLPVERGDTVLEGLMWQVWLDLEEELQERSPFDPIIELMNSAEAPKLLGAVPQMNVPVDVAATLSYQSTLDDVMKHATVAVQPVDFQFTNALVESSRLAYAQVTKGKILASRHPNLMIGYMSLPRFGGRVSDRSYAAASNCASYAAGLT